MSRLSWSLWLTTSSAGLSSAWRVPLEKRQVETPGYSSGIPVTLTTTLPAASITVNTFQQTHGLGGPTKPLSAAPFAATGTSSIDWAALPTPNLANLVRPPGSGANSSITKRCDEHRPSAVDWRDYYGHNWLATVQDQGACGSCWAFAATGMVEAQARIEHGLWSKRSEADLHDMSGWSCPRGGWVEVALDYAVNNDLGIADTQCDLYTQEDQPWSTCEDRDGRALKFPRYTPVYDLDDQKRWIAEVGPLAACFNVYNDFYYFDWAFGKAYLYDGVSTSVGGHCVVIVGYSDEVGGWLFRNSWGPYWGMGGYGYIGYNTAAIDVWQKFGTANFALDAWSKRKHQNGNLYQTREGATHRDFKLLRSDTTGIGGLQVLTRTGEAPFNWTAGWWNLLDGTVPYGQPVLTGSSYGDNLEAVFVNTFGGLSRWRFSQKQQDWFAQGYDVGWWDGQQHYAPFYFQQSLKGYPGLTQLDDSSFALVVRTEDGGLNEYARNAETGRWSYEPLHAIAPAATIKQTGPSLIQSNVGLDIYNEASQGNVYVAAVLGTGQIQLFWRSGGGNQSWRAGEVFGSGIGDTPPVMIQDFWRTADEKAPGGFQLLVAADGGKVQHWQRTNDDINEAVPQEGEQGKWELVFEFGSSIRHAWSLLHGSFSQALEAVVEDMDGNLVHWQFTNDGWREVTVISGVPGG